MSDSVKYVDVRLRGYGNFEGTALRYSISGKYEA